MCCFPRNRWPSSRKRRRLENNRTINTVHTNHRVEPRTQVNGMRSVWAVHPGVQDSLRPQSSSPRPAHTITATQRRTSEPHTECQQIRAGCKRRGDLIPGFKSKSSPRNRGRDTGSLRANLKGPYESRGTSTFQGIQRETGGTPTGRSTHHSTQ